MKKSIYVFVFVLFVGFNSFSQEINKLTDRAPIRKGKITLKDGNSVKFKSLVLRYGLFSYYDMNGIAVVKNSEEVYKITKSGNYAGYGALLGGLSGILVCLEYTRNKIDYDVNQSYNTGLKYNDLTASEWLLITTVGAGIGGFVGMFFKKEKIVYKNIAVISFFPSVGSTPVGNYYPKLSLKINLQ